MQSRSKRIFIIGCGNLGSYLAYLLALRNLDSKLFDELVLIDRDIVEEKNFPYVYQGLTTRVNKFLGYPKVSLLRCLLKQLDKDLKISIFYNDYVNIINAMNISESDLLIDSRDTNDESSLFKIKIQSEKNFGRVIVNPYNIKNNNFSHYIMGTSKFYANYFAHLIIRNYVTKIDSYPKTGRFDFLINLITGRRYKLHANQTNSIRVV
jgi:hypothetical protein